jgi:hypothetical protein
VISCSVCEVGDLYTVVGLERATFVIVVVRPSRRAEEIATALAPATATVVASLHDLCLADVDAVRLE